jgi:hypothetical protein
MTDSKQPGSTLSRTTGMALTIGAAIAATVLTVAVALMLRTDEPEPAAPPPTPRAATPTEAPPIGLHRDLRKAGAGTLFEALELPEPVTSGVDGPEQAEGSRASARASHPPSIALADVDGDGREDVYVATLSGPNVLLLNTDEGIEDGAADWGVDFSAPCLSAAFADFDNDGDPDLIVGPRAEPALFLENRRGRFVARDPGLPLPSAVAEILIADPNNDALLDAYLARETDHGLQGILLNNQGRGRFAASSREAAHEFRSASSSAQAALPVLPDAWEGKVQGLASGRPFVTDRDGQWGALWVDVNNSAALDLLTASGSLLLDLDGQTLVELDRGLGLPDTGDMGTVAALDFDQDGWSDAVVSPGPKGPVGIYRNRGQELAETRLNRWISVRLVGGNHKARSSEEWSNRDGLGATLRLALGGQSLVRTHSCCQGLAAQSSSSMNLGIGPREAVATLQVVWPSGKSQALGDIPAGTRLTVYENPEQSPTSMPFVLAGDEEGDEE